MLSPLEAQRLLYRPPLPSLLLDLSAVSFGQKQKKGGLEEMRPLFPHTFETPHYRLEKRGAKARPLKVGVLFSGGQAPGGHNVICALLDALLELSPSSELIGFLGGPKGVLENRFRRLTQEEGARYRNLGGFDWIGSGRDKIETEEQMERARLSLKASQLDGLVIIGGDDSNTNGALLAEYLKAKGEGCVVVGIPKTIDGDLQSEEIEISFGFDSAAKTYAELIGNIARDALSAKKYYHFIKLMGRSASHLVLECALATHPNLALIGEERPSLKALIDEMATLIIERGKQGKEYGVFLFPEGLIEFIPEIAPLLEAIAQKKSLSPEQQALFSSFPEAIQRQLTLELDPHGNVPLSQIETEHLLIGLVAQELKKRGFEKKFSPVPHFFGYEGRSCLPSNFDAAYTQALGRAAALAIRDQITGGIVAIRALSQPPENWTVELVPLTSMLRFELRKGKRKPVIQKTLVDTKSPLFLDFCSSRKKWRVEDCYRYPGPIQFFGDKEVSHSPPILLGGRRDSKRPFEEPHHRGSHSDV